MTHDVLSTLNQTSVFIRNEETVFSISYNLLHVERTFLIDFIMNAVIKTYVCLISNQVVHPGKYVREY